MGLGYMADVGSAKNREKFKCVGEGAGYAGKGCGVDVHPGGMEHIEDVEGQPIPHRLGTALEQGAEYVKPTKTASEEQGPKGEPTKVTRTGHLVEHPPRLEVTSDTHPERQKELGPPGSVKHLVDQDITVRGAGKGGSDLKQKRAVDAVSAEHIDRKLCPDCHKRLTKRTFVASAKGKTPEDAAAKVQAATGGWSGAKAKAGLKRSLELLGELLEKATGEIGKSKSDDWISDKISLLVREGKPQDQAIAIAHSMAGRKKIAKSAALFLRGDLVKAVGEFGQQGGPELSRAEVKRQVAKQKHTWSGGHQPEGPGVTYEHYMAAPLKPGEAALTPRNPSDPSRTPAVVQNEHIDKRTSGTQSTSHSNTARGAAKLYRDWHRKHEEGHKESAKTASDTATDLRAAGQDKAANQVDGVVRSHNKAAAEHGITHEMASRVMNSHKSPTKISMEDVETQRARAKTHSANTIDAEESAKATMQRLGRKQDRTQEQKAPKEAARRVRGMMRTSSLPRTTKRNKPERTKPPWRKSLLFLGNDLFKSDAPMYLRSELWHSGTGSGKLGL